MWQTQQSWQLPFGDALADSQRPWRHPGRASPPQIPQASSCVLQLDAIASRKYDLFNVVKTRINTTHLGMVDTTYLDLFIVIWRVVYDCLNHIIYIYSFWSMIHNVWHVYMELTSFRRYITIVWRNGIRNIIKKNELWNLMINDAIVGNHSSWYSNMI